MFVYLTKKIAIPNGVKLKVVAWNHDQGWIACGADTGLLKVLRLESPGKGDAKSGSNLSMNQTLEGHQASVCAVAWNNHYRKLTSSDASGLIIVWTLHKGLWYEEMVNNRKKSVVKDLAWNNEGKCVCIIYEDGAVIVGGVDGSRVWGTELDKNLVRITWSADSKYLLFGLANGDVDLHDGSNGSFLSKIPILCVESGSESSPNIVGLEWSHYAPTDKADQSAVLAICYSNGKAQLMKGDTDEKPYLVDTALKVTSMHWNPQGTLIAFAGMPLVVNADEKPIVTVQFYSNTGVHLRTLRVPGSHCGGVTWEGQGLRIALAVDSYIYFANIRPDYLTAYFNNTCVYSYPRPDHNDTAVMYWNVKSFEKNIKSVRRLSHVKAAGDVCALVMRSEDLQQYMIQLTNAIGAPVDVRYIDIEPKVVAINESRVAVCSSESVYVWQFQAASSNIDMLDPVSIQQGRKETTEFSFHVDDIVLADSPPSTFSKKNATQDYICAAEMSEKYLIVGRESGAIQIYTLAPMASVARFQFNNRPQTLKINCNSTQLAFVDPHGLMCMMPIDESLFSPVSRPAHLLEGFERKDVWDVMWASDNAEMFLVMEKTRMYIFRGTDPEEPVQSAAVPCQFRNLKVKAVVFDDIMSDPEKPTKETVVDFETKSLRDTRELIQTVSAKEGFIYVEDHPHPRLWSLVAEAALANLDFIVAEKAVVRCRDYAAIQFVKRIQTLDDAQKQRAEINAYYHRFDEAEKIYKDMDRKDLALELRARLGDWFRVVQLVQEGGGDQSLLQLAWENIGDFYADRQKWTKAAQYYTQCKNYDKLSQMYYAQEDFKSLEKLIDQAEHDKELLVKMGKMFLSVGLSEASVNAYLRADEIRKAVDCCVELNQWDKAVALAEKYQLSDIGQYLSKYATHLVEKDQIPQAIELYRKSGQHGDAAKLIAQLAQQVASQNEPLKAKKYHVLAALEVETFRKKQSTLDNKTASQVVDDLLKADNATGTDKSLDSAWRGAEAFHFYLISQQHLANGSFENALCTAMRLTEYTDLLSPVDAYSLIALTAYYNKNFGLCSKAFSQLESIEESKSVSSDSSSRAVVVSEVDLTRDTGLAASLEFFGKSEIKSGAKPTVSLNDDLKKFGDLAVVIFTSHQPIDSAVDRAKCPKCSQFNREWSSSCSKCQHPFQKCMVTGKAIVDVTGFWQCHTCHHRCIESEIHKYKNCPLCHASRTRAM